MCCRIGPSWSISYGIPKGHWIRWNTASCLAGVRRRRKMNKNLSTRYFTNIKRIFLIMRTLITKINPIDGENNSSIFMWCYCRHHHCHYFAVSQMYIEVWSIVELNLSFLEDTFTKFSAIIDENNFYFLFKHYLFKCVCVCMGGCACLCIK